MSLAAFDVAISGGAAAAVMFLALNTPVAAGAAAAILAGALFFSEMPSPLVITVLAALGAGIFVSRGGHPSIATGLLLMVPVICGLEFVPAWLYVPLTLESFSAWLSVNSAGVSIALAAGWALLRHRGPWVRRRFTSRHLFFAVIVGTVSIPAFAVSANLQAANHAIATAVVALLILAHLTSDALSTWAKGTAHAAANWFSSASMASQPTAVGTGVCRRFPSDVRRALLGAARGSRRAASLLNDAREGERSARARSRRLEGDLQNALDELRTLKTHHARLRRPKAQGERQCSLLNGTACMRKDRLAVLSHELRTPLHGLIATLDMLRDEQLSSEGDHQLAAARTSATSLLQLTNDVLDIVRLDSSSFPLELKAFRLQPLMREIVEEFRAQAISKGITLRLKMNGKFPASFVGDRQRIKQVVSNLLANAIRFTAEGEIRVELTYAEGPLVVDVSDTGPGIPPAMQEAIFEPFTQAGGSEARVAGAGLGLAISQRLCAAMGGELTLARSDSTGSTFRAELPLETSDEEALEEVSRRVFVNPSAKILVVEDHEIDQFVVRSMLDALKCEAVVVGSGDEALRKLEQERFDLILMDCRMLGMDGYETTRRARPIIGSSVPIIAMTANTSVEEREACFAAGMNDYLVKPFGRAELSNVLCRWLDPSLGADNPGDGRSGPALDEAVFAELWESLRWRDEPMRKISDRFAETVRSTLQALETHNHTSARRQLHTLLGTSGMIGAREVRRIAALMQRALKADAHDELVELRSRLIQACDAFSNAFKQKLDREVELSGRTPPTRDE